MTRLRELRETVGHRDCLFIRHEGWERRRVPTECDGPLDLILRMNGMNLIVNDLDYEEEKEEKAVLLVI